MALPLVVAAAAVVGVGGSFLSCSTCPFLFCSSSASCCARHRFFLCDLLTPPASLSLLLSPDMVVVLSLVVLASLDERDEMRAVEAHILTPDRSASSSSDDDSIFLAAARSATTRLGFAAGFLGLVGRQHSIQGVIAHELSTTEHSP